MELNEFMKEILNKSTENNFENSEIYLNKSENFEFRLYKGEVDYYEENEEYGVAFRGEYQDKMGYSYTERIDESVIDTILKNAKNNALIMDEDKEEIYSGSDEYKELPALTGIYEYDREKKIELLKSIEKKIYDLDDRIRNINYCIYADEKTGEQIINNKNLALNYENDIAYIYLSVIAEDKGEVHTASNYQLFRDINELNPDVFARKIVDDAVNQFGAETVKSDQYSVILRNEVFIDILSTFSSTFSAENVQKGLSLFKDKLGKKVADSKVNLIDDPFYEKGYRRTPFDSEGAAAKFKKVIKDGKLTTYLHNLKTAKKSNTETTGNAYRASHKSKISISPTNMYLQKGEHSFKKLIEKLNEGLIIEDVQGLHSGANQVSGDFSLSARGFYVKDKAIVKPVEQITISGNFLQLLKDIKIIGSDFKMGLPGSGHIGSASVLVKKLDISGS
ncbi:MAG TPA: TldD/PmbA family protein [Halanaerobiales bacterium]|nr:TldD/PmbA family protein [Halanaerobiales bacterium]